MVAGASAGESAELALQRARALEQQAAAQRALAGRMTVANETELRTSQVLSRLTPFGYVHLADRRWPGSCANVDLVLVGPSGVYVVDTKCWADVSIARDRIFRGQADVTDEVANIRDLVQHTRTDLAEAGLAPTEVVPVLVLAGMRDIHEDLNGIHVVGEHDVLGFVARRGDRLREVQVDAVLARCLALFPPMSARPGEVPRPRQEMALQPPAHDQLALIDDTDLKQAHLEAAMAQPIEDWMTFLHPEQAKHIQRTFNGPARVRGAAGTGKTVVGLHRAAYLASTRPGRVLYTSFLRTLPVVLREYYSRLSPQRSTASTSSASTASQSTCSSPVGTSPGSTSEASTRHIASPGRSSARPAASSAFRRSGRTGRTRSTLSSRAADSPGSTSTPDCKGSAGAFPSRWNSVSRCGGSTSPTRSS